MPKCLLLLMAQFIARAYAIKIWAASEGQSEISLFNIIEGLRARIPLKFIW